MISRKNPALGWKLYVITQKNNLKLSLEDTVLNAIRGGASVIQLRDKEASDAELLAQARSLLKLTRRNGVPLIINDRIQVARDSGADGVHLGQDDADYDRARASLREKAIIGRSTHSPEQALAAEKEGFDYIGVGPVFATPTKPDYTPVGLELVKFAAANIKIPFVAIGGIDATNVSQVTAAGAKTVAVVRAVMTSSNPAESSRQILLNMNKK